MTAVYSVFTLASGLQPTNVYRIAQRTAAARVHVTPTRTELEVPLW